MNRKTQVWMQVATWLFITITVVGFVTGRVLWLQTLPAAFYLLAALVYAGVAITFFFGVLTVFARSSARHRAEQIAHIVFYILEVLITGGIFWEFLRLAHVIHH